MNSPFQAHARRREAQTLVFFLLAWGLIMLLCGLAIDSGLLYLAKARLSRAVDGAALAAIGNFNRSSNPTTNRDAVASIMRNFAVANFTSLGSISASGGASGGTAGTYTQPNGSPGVTYTYNFNDGTQDANGAYRRFVQVVLTTGSSGQIVSATCNARCPVSTYFIGYGYYFIGNGQSKNYAKIGGYSGPSSLVDLKVSSSAVATRNPRLIMVVIDRSASMLEPGGGASGLPPAIVQFLDFFDTSSDYIGIVSFGSAARLEMPLTTNFIIAGTNNLTDAYETNSAGAAHPGVDPESVSGNAKYDPNYATSGVRRLKFGGATAADDGIRLAMEQLMANGGFNNPNVVKYMVLFTDGQWNAARTMVAAPGYTNEVTVPTADATHVFVNHFVSSYMTNGQWQLPFYGVNYEAPWQNIYYATNNYAGSNVNLMVMPTLSPVANMTNAVQVDDFTYDYAQLATNHLNDTWLSSDGTTNETLASPSTSLAGAPQFVSTNSWVGNNGTTNYYTHNFDVWLQPGAVAYLYHSGAVSNAYVSDYTAPQKHISLYVNSGDKVDLVVPWYVTEGILYDGIDLAYPDNPGYGESGYPRYRADNFQQAYMWPDDTSPIPNPLYSSPYQSNSLERQLMFRNYANLLTGYYVSRPDYPLGTGYEPLITDQYPPGAPRARDGLGPYYPSAAFYWPFDLVGVDIDPTYALIDPNSGLPDAARHGAYSINMLSAAAAPEWSGELFYKSISGGGTNVTSGAGTTSASQIMTSADWLAGAPSWLSASALAGAGIMTNEPAHNTTITPNPSIWRPVSFNGSQFGSIGLGSVTPSGSLTGGYVSDGAGGHIYKDAMAYSGRPTHYFDFSQSKWIPITNNHIKNAAILNLGNWKAQEYAWHARALGVTIYTVGYGNYVTDTEQAFLAQIANATNTTAGGGSSITYNPSQPIGQQFYATNAAQISNDFYSVGQAINEALTQ